MEQGFTKIRRIVTWPEFQPVWILLAVVGVAFAMDIIVFESAFLLLIEGGLLLVAAVLVVLISYRAARTDRDTKIDQGELKSILGSLNDGLIVYDENFRAIFFNPAAERLFGLPAKSVLGHTFVPQDVEREGWRKLIQIIFPSLAPRVIARSKEGEYPQVADVSFTDPQLELRVTTAPVSDEGGRTLGFMRIVRDRTAQIGALRARSEFVTIASHQLRGPITDINWALQSLATVPEISDDNKLIIQNALAASGGMLRRIEDLLSIAKMEEGKFGYTFAETNAVDLIGKVLADILPAARKAGVKIYFDRPAGELPKAIIDAGRLSIALVNILENAIRYNVENGEVTVKVDVMPGKPFLEVSVKDTGIGIPAESIEKIFTKFYRADNAMKSQTEGSGLGLYMAKNVIMAHGGEIWIDSELNRGTTVHFTLPTDVNLAPKREVGAEELY